MDRWRRMVVMMAVCLIPVLGGDRAWAGTRQGPKEKLPAPTSVSCPLTSEGVLVSFDAVPDAHAYQVEFVCADVDGSFATESLKPNPLTSPALITAEDCDGTVIAVHVRALPEPKHEGQPTNAGGPKGEWSDECVVPVVAP